ncbi:DUF975 family protein [Caloramator sp. CAR-1]|uniref:DUF975 family protein n=1 Tax=Caloramator sp. CAR-1 TaxID=3062777 RepID=UPI0026E2DE75|nr:DUF975 family protein [Caloramator sp. CAR-1]MDO6353906.1 DUF975 family protein [Caloramator sp. CAR-1]
MAVNQALIKSNSELKAAAREQLKGNWGVAILICLISGLVGSIIGFIPYVGPLLGIIISGPLALGLAISFLKLARREPFKFENLFDGFKNFKTAFLTQLLIAIFIFLWTLLFIIPGIIAGFNYAMAFYIISDNPEIGAMEAIRKSKEMMRGFRWKLFCLNLSFIGWVLLCVLTLGIGFLWLQPYMNASFANFYQNLKEVCADQKENKILQE